jgi:ATP-dependent Clp protease ATP-binding subunit ClpC
MEQRRTVAHRFTESARKIVFFSRYETSQWGSPTIEPYHLLLGLLREGKPVLRLWSLDTPDAVRSVRAEVETEFPFLPWTRRGTLPLSIAGQRVIDYAVEEAEHMGCFHIGVEHFVLAILREENAPASVPVLQKRGLRLPEVRRKINTQSS